MIFSTLIAALCVASTFADNATCQSDACGSSMLQKVTFDPTGSSAGGSRFGRLFGGLKQYTPDQADWSKFQTYPLEKGVSTAHDPDSIDFANPLTKFDSWEPWDGTVYDPSKMSPEDFFKAICPTVDTIRGIKDVFYKHKPFADNKSPTKAEVDEWHRIALNHVRALVGYTSEDRKVKPDHCLFARALWSDERRYTTKWDTKYPDGNCQGKGGHCGATFVPDWEDQKPYLPDEQKTPCESGGASEGIHPGPLAWLPWSIRWSRALCIFLRSEGFWGGHVGPFFHREKFGWSFWESGEHAVFRGKWSGQLKDNLYSDPR